MEKSRLKLHAMLCDVLESRNAYFQPPSSVEMSYPAIVYSREDINNTFADDIVYMQGYYYRLVVIEKSPLGTIAEKVSKLPSCRFVQNYTADNLNHDVFIIKV